MSEHKGYGAGFYDSLDRTARPSAERIVPLVLDLVPAESAVDVGCGDGSWLAVLAGHGVGEIRGVDGDWVRVDQLKIPAERFQRAALDSALGLEGVRCDLAISLEVAEHLPAERAPGFVAELCALAPVVLFSAAIPNQGGTHHVNEQWPDYWAELFAAHGYRPVDQLRWRIWNEPDVTWWYKQNLVIYASEEGMGRFPNLARAAAEAPPGVARLVHPDKYAEALRLGEPGFKRWLKMAPRALARSFKR